MKQLRKMLLTFLCAGVIMSVTACGNNGNADDNGAVNNETTNGTETDNGYVNDTNNDSMNNATDGTGTGTGNNGVVDEIGDNVERGVDDLGNDVQNGVNDVTDNLIGNNNR